MTINQNNRIKKTDSYWQFNCRWVVFLSVIALIVTLLPLIFAKHLSTYMLFGWPMLILIVAFGIPFFYLLIIGFYTWVMDVRERTK